MKPRAHTGKVFEVIGARFIDRGHEIYVRRFAAETVVLRNHEAAKASQFDLARQARIEVS
jgi:hypothetical protein